MRPPRRRCRPRPAARSPGRGRGRPGPPAAPPGRPAPRARIRLRAMALRCVYTDLDGTLLGRHGSLFHDAEGEFSLLQARAIEACHRAGVEIVVKSGRREAQVMEDSRLMGQTAYIFEVGCGVVIDGEKTIL